MELNFNFYFLYVSLAVLHYFQKTIVMDNLYKVVLVEQVFQGFVNDLFYPKPMVSVLKNGVNFTSKLKPNCSDLSIFL